MQNGFLRSARAFGAAFAAVLFLSFGTDFLLAVAGLPVHRLNDASAALVVTIIAYRNAYNGLGAYLVARLAPARPLEHALALGAFGFIGSLAATLATWNMHLGPPWYSLSIVVLAVPSAWAGGQVFSVSRQRRAGPRQGAPGEVSAATRW